MSNVFTNGLDAYRKRGEQSKPQTRKKDPEQNEEWRIITESDNVRFAVVDMIEELGDISYGPIPFAFEGFNGEAIAVSVEIVRRLNVRKGAVFVAFHKGWPKRWTVSLKYSTGDVSPYLGQKPRPKR